MKLTDVLLRRKSGAVNQEESPGGWSEEVQAVPVPPDHCREISAPPGV